MHLVVVDKVCIQQWIELPMLSRPVLTLSIAMPHAFDFLVELLLCEPDKSELSLFNAENLRLDLQPAEIEAQKECVIFTLLIIIMLM